MAWVLAHPSPDSRGSYRAEKTRQRILFYSYRPGNSSFSLCQAVLHVETRVEIAIPKSKGIRNICKFSQQKNGKGCSQNLSHGLLLLPVIHQPILHKSTPDGAAVITCACCMLVFCACCSWLILRSKDRETKRNTWKIDEIGSSTWRSH